MLQEFTGIDFEEGWQDCYTLAQKYYAHKLGLTLRDYARPARWHMIPNFNFFDQLFQREGFKHVTSNANDVVIGDSLLMTLGRTEVINHVAIYVGQGQILHHLTGLKSRLDIYNLRWRERVTKVLRHPASEMAFDTVSAETLAKLPYSIRQQFKQRG